MKKPKNYYTDRLMRHLEVCVQCRASKLNPSLRLCPTGRDLTRKTLDERHPDPERNTR